MAERTVVQYYGPQVRQECGYCNQTKTSNSHSMWAHRMTVHDYQDLIDRGWRRSGKYCYKPTMSDTCCPSYTIRCDSQTFALSKSQKKVIKKVNRFLLNGLPELAMAEQETPAEPDAAAAEAPACVDPMAEHAERGAESMDLSAVDRSDEPGELTTTATPVCAAMSVDDTPSTNTPSTAPRVHVATSSAPTNGNGAAGGDGTRPPQKKAKLLRLERRAAKLQQKAATESSSPTSADALPSPKPPQNSERSLAELLALAEQQPGSRHQLRLVLRTAVQSLEETPELVPLYQKYQMRVHGDELSKLSAKSFERFLVHSPFGITHTAAGPAAGYGTFHHQYWLDGQLVAVGVLDILPRCVSAVYFFYDPDWARLSLGTYSAFCELQLVRELHAGGATALRHYYMGYYIHSCAKMRYKAHMRPSALLCPETYGWHTLDAELLRRLDASKYLRLASDPDALDADHYRVNEAAAANADCDGVRMLLDERLALTFGQLRQRRTMRGSQESAMRAYLDEWGELVGRALSQRIVFMV